MAFMGYETPVEMPSMGIYNTDLMKMYIAGVKDQYEKGQEEMKDFMKLYGDFYSPIAGDTQRYNDMTVGGARDMINQMLANGIDPYKSPEARAAISRYINSVPTGVLNAMKQNAENRKKYDEAVAQARFSGKLDPEYETWALKQAGLDNFSTIGPNGEIRTWDRLAPEIASDMTTVATPYFDKFKKDEKLKSDITGYTKWGVSDENQKQAIDSAVEHLGDTSWGRYKIAQANEQAAAILGPTSTAEERNALANKLIRDQVHGVATQYFQPKYEVDPYYKSDYETANNIRQYWATTGANTTPGGGSRVKNNGTSKGGAHGDSGKWSRYASITYSTMGNRDDFAAKNKIPVYSIADKKTGKKQYRYGEWITVPGTNQKALMVQIEHGGQVINGKHYRLVTDAEIQKHMFTQEVAKNKANNKPTSSWDLWNTQAVKTGNDEDLTQITYTPSTAKYLYDVSDVMAQAIGSGAKATGRTHGLRDYAKKMHKVKAADGTEMEAPTTIYDTHEAADIELKNGHTGKYTRVVVDFGHGPVEMLYKLGEYDENGHMVSSWATRMSENDRIMSEETVGASDAVEIYN